MGIFISEQNTAPNILNENEIQTLADFFRFLLDLEKKYEINEKDENNGNSNSSNNSK